MSRTGTFEAPSVHARGLSGLRRKRARAALDRVLWTATGIALGFGRAIVATFIYFREAWM
jgi:hypothetical protein